MKPVLPFLLVGLAALAPSEALARTPSRGGPAPGVTRAAAPVKAVRSLITHAKLARSRHGRSYVPHRIAGKRRIPLSQSELGQLKLPASESQAHTSRRRLADGAATLALPTLNPTRRRGTETARVKAGWAKWEGYVYREKGTVLVEQGAVVEPGARLEARGGTLIIRKGSRVGRDSVIEGAGTFRGRLDRSTVHLDGRAVDVSLKGAQVGLKGDVYGFKAANTSPLTVRGMLKRPPRLQKLKDAARRLLGRSSGPRPIKTDFAINVASNPRDMTQAGGWRVSTISNVDLRQQGGRWVQSTTASTRVVTHGQ